MTEPTPAVRQLQAEAAEAYRKHNHPDYEEREARSHKVTEQVIGQIEAQRAAKKQWSEPPVSE